METAASRGWTAAGIDVKTAFLLAPRRSEGTLNSATSQDLGPSWSDIPQHEVWRARQALYGLQSLGVTLWPSGSGLDLRGTTAWNVQNWGFKTTCGSVIWTTFYSWVTRRLCSRQWIRCGAFGAAHHRAGCLTEEPMKFCGFQLRRKTTTSWCGRKPKYAVELCRRHGCSRSWPTLMSTALADRMLQEKDEDIDLELQRKARAFTGELFWLMVGSTAFVAGVMGRLSSRTPGTSWGLVTRGPFGADNHLPLRSMTVWNATLMLTVHCRVAGASRV